MAGSRDIYWAYGWLATLVLAVVAYGVRLAIRGPARSGRVGQLGGSVLLDREVMDWTYWFLGPVVRLAVAARISANALTWSALVLGLGAGAALAAGWFGLATVLATASTLEDILDGQVARATRTGSARGELLDAAVDRYTEFAFLAGLAIYFRDSVPLLGLVLGAILASFMISYSTAKAEALQVVAPRGLMRRHERSSYLIVGAAASALWPALPDALPLIIALALVAVVGNASAVFRLSRISRALA